MSNFFAIDKKLYHLYIQKGQNWELFKNTACSKCSIEQKLYHAKFIRSVGGETPPIRELPRNVWAW
ncbi:hypothetical protein CO057_01105 [Candidatus Uhrbacteria bacterium CG_4_9_14_0_2_um_filter_41_50]|uniref:Uncharacterized protein n=1 Tax=Candidatus Uhrbacteria bacterium CG_4_9_14_0_2_um_filter_41_50 TaxID=1975031 RepID=A0A2M8EPS9_9BACT|nr:MAG: hypothetical protein COZ45_02870 [Candidatus Uhrbacteria bacterium CG_4_10_14_3_um_filter_41_21]PIZ54306.1 MAG: hypothetical protein COY24_04270 [Candidatus Uhrbacteria bacterium CG_4_10_14_0_2_um_filter_41_21]PJB85061.1 MAG: hypothetical protein CO086_00330 [Candidatus Uhrbacteria bacterium CG_4_9_14_0_8_um_filter_41_16]PJC24753.1 MAG: hypothetical protein CO057_01105 [Candidatus Uhrbacteria bacterium CG_4_9_14_0_2_um_filter_41_50]PJE75354.1 MAG: hypothetical protein COV03_00525 [Candi